MTAFETAWQSAHDIEGWLTEGQGRRLFDVARSCPDSGTIVEIGSYRGRSTVLLGLAAPSDSHVVAIDPHAGTDRGPQEISGYADDAERDHQEFQAHLERAGVSDKVRHVRLFSDEAHDEVEAAIDVLYIDGAHRFGPARADIRDWGGRVADGGTMLIHDSFSSVGVTAAIARELFWSNRFRFVGNVRSLAVYQVEPDINRWSNLFRQLTRLPWFIKNIVVKVLIAARILRGRNWPY